MQFEKLSRDSYKLLIARHNGAKHGVFKAHLFNLSTECFLDFVPTEFEFATNQADLVSFSMFRAHLLVCVTKFEPELELAFFDFEWLEKHLKEIPAAIAHPKENDAILLTAETTELQQFVLNHLAEGKL